MITTADEPRDSKIVRIAILASIAVHLFAFLLAGFSMKSPLAHFFKPKIEKEEMVTLSQAITIDRKKKPVPVPAPPRRPAQVPVRPQVAVRPQTAQLPVPPITVPRDLQPKVLEKPAPAASQKPEESTKKKSVRVNKRVAQISGEGTATAAPEAQRVREHVVPPRQNALSSSQVAQIEQQFARTIAQARSDIDPMRNTAKQNPTTTIHPKMQLEGFHDQLERGEGILRPATDDRGRALRWYKDGWIYYYVYYEYTYPDGTYESDNVPWPIRYKPGARTDPFEYVAQSGRQINIPLPPPLPDYKLPAGIQLKPLLRAYFPDRYPNG